MIRYRWNPAGWCPVRCCVVYSDSDPAELVDWLARRGLPEVLIDERTPWDLPCAVLVGNSLKRLPAEGRTALEFLQDAWRFSHAREVGA